MTVVLTVIHPKSPQNRTAGRKKLLTTSTRHLVYYAVTRTKLSHVGSVRSDLRMGGFTGQVCSSSHILFFSTWPKSSRVEWRRSSELSVIFMVFHPQPPLLNGIRRN